MSDRFYKSGIVNKQGREMYMNAAAKTIDDVKKVATALYVAGYHTTNQHTYEHYWSEASEFVDCCNIKIEAYYEKLKKEAEEAEEAEKIKKESELETVNEMLTRGVK